MAKQDASENIAQSLGLIIIIIIILAGTWLWNFVASFENVSGYPHSSASYIEVKREVGCNSDYSDEKRSDIFKSKYKNKWMTWRGDVENSSSGRASLDVNGLLADIDIHFDDNNAGYDLKKGESIEVKFVMKKMIGCSKFLGKFGEIIE